MTTAPEPAVQMPHSEECERAVLAGLQIDAETWLPAIEARITVDDFHLERHRLIYRAMQQLAGDGEPVDLRTIQAQLEAQGKLEDVGGVAYLAGLDVDLPDMHRLDSYADVLRERSLRRQLATACASIYRRAVSGSVEASDLLDEADDAVYSLLKSSQRGVDSAVHLGTQMRLVGARLEAGSRPITPGIATGFDPLDRVTYGLRPGKLWLVAARPSKGKSAFALQVALRAARDQRRVLLISAEMDAESLALRGLAHGSGVPLDWIADGVCSDLNRQSISVAIERYGDAAVDLYEDCPTVEEISLRCSLYRQKHETLDLVVVDYIQLLKPTNPRDDARSQVGHISRGLKELAKRMRVPVLACCQLKRLRDDWDRPTLADLKETGQLEQDADVVLFPWAEKEQSSHSRDVGELIVAKNRDGAKATIKIVFDKQRQTFRLLADEEAAQRTIV